tara:strand:- start:2482 stop:2967 length:486 start_codon:yes stop_codon:yes gene_type:complete
MLDYKYPVKTYKKWFNLLKEHIEEKYAGTNVEVESAKSGILYESYNKLHDDEYIFSATICINKELYPRTRLYALLHEAGHIERMVQDRDQVTFFYRYFDNAPDNIKLRTRTVIEEVLAWHKAEQIANSLDIKLENRPWQIEIEKAIRLYTLWCAEKGDKNG